MHTDPFPLWFGWFVPAWILFVILSSVVFRRVRGKPIFPRIPGDAIFAERTASGPWAQNCLMVAVSRDRILVTPFFPFNLMFLPEIYGMELNIPIASVRSAAEAGRFGSNVLVIHGETDKKLRLKLRNPAAFVEALNRMRS